MTTVGGASSFLNQSTQDYRLTFLQNFNKINLAPFLHSSSINFIGMGLKRDYLLWREDDCYFTAMHKNFSITSWSIITGKHVPTLRQNKSLKNKIKDFEIYAACDEDDTYKGN